MSSAVNQLPETTRNLVFVPFSETLLEKAGTPLGTLVPFDLKYECVRLLDGTYDFSQLAPPLMQAPAC